MWITYVLNELRKRWLALKESRDGGYSTETVIIVAAMAALALVAMAAIAAAVTSKADSIDLG